MAIDHEAHKIRVKAVSDKMNHPMEYNDAGAPRLKPDLNNKKMTLQEQDRENRTKELWQMGAYDKRGTYVGVGKGVKHK
jgi:hypothetical protein